MSLPATLARVAELQSLLHPAPPAPPPTSPTASAAAFPAALQSAMGPAATAAIGAPAGSGVGARIVELARNEVGVTEQPPGSNNSPRIATYRTATAGSGVGPWCAYFTSWLAREAGAPIGPNGGGMGLVDAVWSWGQGTGKAIPASSGPPQPGDLVVWDEHIGIVESVLPDGRIQTIEGNSSNMVARRTHPPGGGIIGYVRLG